MNKLYLWWDFTKNIPSVVSPESVALYHYVANHFSCTSSKEFQIIGANNLDIYGGGYEFPLLVVTNSDTQNTATEYVSGYFNIVLYLSNLEERDLTLRDKMLLNYVCNNLTLLTEYQLFLNLDNYKTFTKPHLLTLFPFPFNWLNDPMRLKNSIELKLSKSLKIGYVNEEDADVDEMRDDDEEEETTEVEYIEHDENFDENMKKYLFQNKKDNKLSILKYHTQYKSKLQSFFKIYNNQISQKPPHPSIQCLIQSNMDIQLNKLPNCVEIRGIVPDFEFIEASEPVPTSEIAVSKPSLRESNYNILCKIGFS